MNVTLSVAANVSSERSEESLNRPFEMGAQT